MKSEFMLAFNEICEARGLPKEVVIEALKTALVSAYRRNTNSSNNQEITVEIDERTGEPTIFAEKEVVEWVLDSRTEVLIKAAKSAGYTDVELGETAVHGAEPATRGVSASTGVSACSARRRRDG